GYIKRTSMLSFTRSGGEWNSSGVKDGDIVKQVLQVNTLDSLLVFTKKGQYYLLPVHQVPEFKWKENGTAIVNVIPIAKDDGIVTVIPVKDFTLPQTLLFITRRGQIKRSELKDYVTTRSNAITACKVAEGDELINVLVSDQSKQIMLISEAGMAIRFDESEVNSMGRATGGVKGISLKAGDVLISALLVEPSDEGEILVVSNTGHGKRTLLFDYSIQARGGK